MKWWATIGVLLLLAAVTLWWRSHLQPYPGAPANQEIARAQPLTQTVAGVVSSTVATPSNHLAARPLERRHWFDAPARLAPAGAPRPLEFTNFSARTVLQNVRHALHSYGSVFGGNPVGGNLQITRALAGGNPRQINFLDPSAGLRINAEGRLVDPWGTPYFFHQLSGLEMEIHSAGPDRILWTQDDLVIK